MLGKTGLPLEQIRAKLVNNEDQGNWLICPEGEAKDAIEINEFLQSPDHFQRLAGKKRQEIQPTPDRSQAIGTDVPF